MVTHHREVVRLQVAYESLPRLQESHFDHSGASTHPTSNILICRLAYVPTIAFLVSPRRDRLGVGWFLAVGALRGAVPGSRAAWLIGL